MSARLLVQRRDGAIAAVCLQHDDPAGLHVLDMPTNEEDRDVPMPCINFQSGDCPILTSPSLFHVNLEDYDGSTARSRTVTVHVVIEHRGRAHVCFYGDMGGNGSLREAGLLWVLHNCLRFA